MARSLASARSSIQKLSARCQPYFSTICAERPTLGRSHAGKHLRGAAPALLGRSRSQTLEENVNHGCEDWRRFQPQLKIEIWGSNGVYNSCSFTGGKVLYSPGAILFRRNLSIWGARKTQQDSPETGPLLETKDGVSTFESEDAPVVVEGEWTEKIHDKLMDSIKVVEDAFYRVAPQVEEILEKYPIVADIAAPVGVFTGAWIILPRVLRRLHRNMEHGSTLLYKGLSETPFVQVPYEQSVWKAMEFPSRLFATILTMLQVGRLVAPNAMADHYMTQFWAGGGILCILWFLHSWKTNVLSRLLTQQSLSLAERERYLTVDKFSSLGLVFMGVLGLAEAYDLKIQSLLTLGGIGGVATAFAAKDILGNMLTGVSLSFSKPFSVGDQIKVGHVEGKVEEVGLHSTKLLNSEKNPIIVPNSFFQSQVIVNKSRARWRYFTMKIPVRFEDYKTVQSVTFLIREMLNHHPQVYHGEDKPRCSISQFTPSSLEITITCNVNPMSTDNLLQVQEDILLEAVAIITRSGAILGPNALL